MNTLKPKHDCPARIISGKASGGSKFWIDIGQKLGGLCCWRGNDRLATSGHQTILVKKTNMAAMMGNLGNFGLLADHQSGCHELRQITH